MKNKILISTSFVLILLTACAQVKFVDQKNIASIIEKSANSWTTEECDKIIEHYTMSNYEKDISARKDVFIRVLPLNRIVCNAMARKEIIQKRLDDKEFYSVLKFYLEAYTSYTVNISSGEIFESDSAFSKGYSFKVFLENITDPYEPIFLEDGYSYFFLENMEGSFSKVLEVTGLYVEDYIQLDGYLNVIITFSPFAEDGKRLFNSKDLDQSYKIVVNGLTKKPIEVEWKVI